MLSILSIILLIVTISYTAESIHIPAKMCRGIVFAMLWLIIGLRQNVGIDYNAYKEMYDNPYAINNLAVEPFWIYFNDLLRWLGFKSRMYFLITSGFTMLGFYKGIQKLSPAFYFSVVIFILSGIYFETANTVRQCCAMSALFWGYGCWYKSQKTNAFILFILAICMHLSAIFGIILIFCSNIRVNKWILFAVVSVCILKGSKIMDLIINKFLPMLADLNKYNYTPDDFDSGISSGLLRYVYDMLGIVIIILFNKIDNKNSICHNLINLTIYGICLYNIFYTFQPARRLYMYGFMFIIILLPYLIKNFKYRSKQIVFCVISSILLLFLIKSNLNTPYSFDIQLF